MAPLGFDFYRGEHSQLLADHLWSHGDGAPADEISRATGQAELHGPVGAWIWELAHLIAEEAQIGTATECEAYLLLEGGLSVHVMQ
jgi:hypothetical protein